MKPPIGLILRLVGPTIEIACLILYRQVGGQGRTVGGLPVEYPLFAGLALGLALVLIGLALGRPSREN